MLRAVQLGIAARPTIQRLLEASAEVGALSDARYPKLWMVNFMENPAINGRVGGTPINWKLSSIEWGFSIGFGLQNGTCVGYSVTLDFFGIYVAMSVRTSLERKTTRSNNYTIETIKNKCQQTAG